MSKKPLDTLTETMFYVLMALSRNRMCGTEIADFVRSTTAGRVSMGPGTLYTILQNFQSEKLIKEVERKGRSITYDLTDKGRETYTAEIDRLKKCIMDAEKQEEEKWER